MVAIFASNNFQLNNELIKMLLVVKNKLQQEKFLILVVQHSHVVCLDPCLRVACSV